MRFDAPWARVALLVPSLLCLYPVAAAASCPPPWTARANMPTARHVPGVAKAGGTIYAIGGYDGSYLATVGAYDPATNTWTAKANISSGRYGVAAAAVGGTIYAMGGFNGSIEIATVEAYDPATNTWSPKASMTRARSLPAVAVVGGTIYAIGGTSSVFSSSLATVEAYDPSTNTWTPMASLPSARTNAAAATVGGTIYVIGGLGGNLTSVQAYDPATNTWATKANLPTGRYLHGAAEMGGTIYAIGGRDAAQLFSTVEAYDRATDTWTSMPSMPVARLAMGVATVGGTIYAIGGLTSLGYSAAVEAYVPVACLEASMALKPSPAVVGEWLAVQFTVTNTGHANATGIVPEIAINVGAGLVVFQSGPVPAGLLALTPGGATTFEWTYSVSGSGSVSFTATATWTVPGPGNTIQVSRTGIQVTQLPASLYAALTVVPSPAVVGQWVAVRLTVTNTGQADATGMMAEIQPDAGSGLLAMQGGPVPAGPLTILPGGATTFEWTYSVSGAGTASFTATASGLGAGLGNPIAASDSGGLVTELPAMLQAALVITPSPAVVGQPVVVRLTVTNTGQRNATAVVPSIAMGEGTGLVVWQSGPVPGGPLTIMSGGTTAFEWTYYAVVEAGFVKFTATATGTESVTGNPIQASATGVLMTTLGASGGPLPAEYPAAEGMVRGAIRIAPNRLDPGAGAVFIYLTGDAGQSADLEIFDETGARVVHRSVQLRGDGLGVVRYDGRDDAGRRLGPGAYWARAAGGGVKDIRPFVVLAESGR